MTTAISTVHHECHLNARRLRMMPHARRRSVMMALRMRQLGKNRDTSNNNPPISSPWAADNNCLLRGGTLGWATSMTKCQPWHHERSMYCLVCQNKAGKMVTRNNNTPKSCAVYLRFDQGNNNRDEGKLGVGVVVSTSRRLHNQRRLWIPTIAHHCE